MLKIHIETLKNQGYVLLKNQISPATVKKLLELIKYYYRMLPKPSSEGTPYLNKGHEILYNLQNKDVYFIKEVLSHDLVKNLLITFLNDPWYKQIPKNDPNYIVRGMVARNGGPEPLPLHIDSFVPGNSPFAWAFQTSFILEDQSPKTGCTVVVPGSHLFNRYADQKDISEAIPIISKAGDILIWNSGLFHGTTGNTSGRTRWALITTYVRWWLKQSFNVNSMPDSIYQQLTDEEKAIMGFCSIPPKDEYERMDLKGGYELLEKNQTKSKNRGIIKL